MNPKKYHLLFLFYSLISSFFISPILSSVSAENLTANKLNQSNPINITFLHTNDIHSYLLPDGNFQGLGGIAKVKTLLDRLKMKHPKQNVLQLDAGDFSEGSLGFLAQKGAHIFQVMQALNYDAIALGNHDWFYGIPQLLNWTRFTQLPLLSANLIPPESDSPLRSPLAPFLFFTKGLGTRHVRVAVVGLSPSEIYYQPFLSPYQISSPIERMKLLMPYFQNQGTDMVIVLSHLGIEKDKELARKVPGINLIVGGHSHSRLNQAIIEKGVPIVQAGSHGQFVGETVLSYNWTSKQSELKSYLLHEVKPSIPDDPRFGQWTKESMDSATQELGSSNWKNTKIAAPTPLLAPENGLSNLGNLLADALKNELKTDFAFVEKRNLSHALEKSRTYNFVDLFNVNPFIFDFTTQKTWTVKIFTVNGKDFNTLLHYLMLVSPEISASGLKLYVSKMFGTTLIDHIELPPETWGAYKSEFNQHSFDEDHDYTFASTQIFEQFLDGLSQIGRPVPPVKIFDTGRSMQDLLSTYLAKGRNTEIFEEANNLHGRYQDTDFDYLVPTYQIKTNREGLTIPLYNMGIYEAPKGFSLKLFIASQPDLQTLPSSQYSLIWEHREVTRAQDQAVEKRSIFISWDKINENRKDLGQNSLLRNQNYHGMILVRALGGSKEGNYLNNFQEAWIEVP